MRPSLWPLLAGLAVLIGLLYVFVFIPNFEACRGEGKPITRCLGHLMR